MHSSQADEPLLCSQAGLVLIGTCMGRHCTSGTSRRGRGGMRCTMPDDHLQWPLVCEVAILENADS